MCGDTGDTGEGIGSWLYAAYLVELLRWVICTRPVGEFGTTTPLPELLLKFVCGILYGCLVGVWWAGCALEVVPTGSFPKVGRDTFTLTGFYGALQLT